MACLPAQVTPSSKTVGDLAQFMVQNKLDEKSVVERADKLNFPGRCAPARLVPRDGARLKHEGAVI